MRRFKFFISTALILSVLGATGCSTVNVPSSYSALEKNSAKVAPVSSLSIEKLSKVSSENLDMTSQEITEIKKLIEQNPEIVKSEGNKLNFGVKTYQEGKDVSVDMLLYHPKAASRAHFWGIKTANELLYAGASPTKRWFLEKKLGGLFASQAFKGEVYFWLARADLLRIKDVSLDDSFLLAMAGITSVPYLAGCNNPVTQGALAVQLALIAFQYGINIPSVNQIRAWTQEATMMSPVLY
jgi:hypothetical protein